MIYSFEQWMSVGIRNGWISPGYCATHDGGYDYLTDEEKVDIVEKAKKLHDAGTGDWAINYNPDSVIFNYGDIERQHNDI